MPKLAAEVSLTKLTSAAEAVLYPLFTARLKPCPPQNLPQNLIFVVI